MGNSFVPMDETLAQVVVDLSNRPHFEMRADFPGQKVGTFDTELVHEFLWKLALEARMNLHVIVHYGQNTHHMIEAVFKALAGPWMKRQRSILVLREFLPRKGCCK